MIVPASTTVVYRIVYIDPALLDLDRRASDRVRPRVTFGRVRHLLDQGWGRLLVDPCRTLREVV